ncbi:unnamed protein product [Ceutorhynchus assimilis]|uniref:Uncharacterized protein n=1 Tax=Ceutorhynchus assimilis TaxID=467358 RepID=A0A9N9QRC9_9CUCU|nr:unnamed protein product [Ceutorhynchus assimilis]
MESMSESETETTVREDGRNIFVNDNYLHLQSVRRAKHEDYVAQKFNGLQKAGLLWSRRIPKVQEPIKPKLHWDFLLEEMIWMSTDFSRERKWKKAAAQKISRTIHKFFHDKTLAAQRAQKENERHMRLVSNLIAKSIKDFWNNIEMLSLHKQLIIMEEARKKELNQKLSIIVNQTEQYSHNIAKQINKSVSTTSSDDDAEFMDTQSDEDIEETLEEEEKDLSEADQAKEVEALVKESKMQLDDDFLREYLLNRDNIRLSSNESDDDSDDEFVDKNSKRRKTLSNRNEEFGNLESILQNDPNDKPDKLLNDAAAIAESIKPNGSTLSSTTVLTKVPFLLKFPLREYQHIGLDWLVTMYDRELNGILADEMGLGKTIQTIALLAYLACEKGNWGPHLIVVPTSVLLNWEMELKKWCPAFKILAYYGSQADRKLKRVGWAKINTFHICITSYNLIIQDQQSFRRKKWKYLILDEAQNIKNFKSERWQLLLNFQTERRLLLTGTPLQNNLMELWSLMHFLMPAVFQSHREFKEWFANPVSGMIEGNMEYNENIIERLHKVLRPFLLRRLKSEVEKQLPKKYEHIIMCRLSKRQRFLYDDYMSREQTREGLAGGTLLRVMNILMQLRKVCNHPNLFEDRPVKSPFQCDNYTLFIPSIVYSAIEHDINKHLNLHALNLKLVLIEMYISSYQFFRCSQTINKTTEQIASAISQSSLPKAPQCKIRLVVPKVAKEKEKNVLQPRNSNNIEKEEEKKAKTIGLKILDQFFPKQNNVGMPNNNNNNFDSSEDNTNQQQPGQQLSDDLKNILRINKRRCMAEPLYGKDFRETCKIFSPNKIFAWACGRLYCLNVLHNKNYTYHSNFLKEALHNPTRRIEALKDIFDRFILYIPTVNSKGPDIRVCRPSPSLYYTNQRQQYLLQQIFSKPIIPLHRIATAMMCQFPDARLIQYDCGKLQKLAELLRKLKNESHRVLVFTQMTKMLDVLEFFFNYHGYIYLRMDGTTKIDQRQILLDRFNNDQRIFAFILSTRSGGVGINLTGADTVIFYDSDWNPTMDAQAQDRCHRIGQTRDVHIYRLISEKTIEENILKKANQKEILCNLAIDGGNFTTSYFTNHSAIVEELFTIDQTLDSAEKRIGKKTCDIDSIMNDKLKSYEKTLAACEDDQDFQATKYAEAEAMANLMEFDESIPPKTFNNKNKEGEVSKELQEINELIGKLSAIEKYALRFIEHTPLQSANPLTAKSRKQIELKKRLLEFNQKRASQKNEEKLEQQELEENKTISPEDSKKVKTKTEGKLLKRKKETEPTKQMPKRSKTKSDNTDITMSSKLRSSIRLKRKNNEKAISSKSDDAEEKTVIKDTH